MNSLWRPCCAKQASRICVSQRRVAIWVILAPEKGVRSVEAGKFNRKMKHIRVYIHSTNLKNGEDTMLVSRIWSVKMRSSHSTDSIRWFWRRLNTSGIPYLAGGYTCILLSNISELSSYVTLNPPRGLSLKTSQYVYYVSTYYGWLPVPPSVPLCDRSFCHFNCGRVTRSSPPPMAASSFFIAAWLRGSASRHAQRRRSCCWRRCWGRRTLGAWFSCGFCLKIG